MSNEEQKRLLGDLLVSELETKKSLACLQSQARKSKDSLMLVLDALRDCNIDFEYVRKIYAEVAGTDIGKLISDMEATCDAVAGIQDDIRKIKNPDSFQVRGGKRP